MIKCIVYLLLTTITLQVTAQKLYTKNASISFINKTNVQNINALNKAGTIVIDGASGAIAMSLLIKSFTFSKALMQQHFNDNYMESNTYPKSEFKGTITNNAAINYKKDGTYPANIKGQLTMHGITKEVTTTGTITVKGGATSATSTFTITLDDYKIKTDQIGKTATITINTGTLTAK